MQSTAEIIVGPFCYTPYTYDYILTTRYNIMKLFLLRLASQIQGLNPLVIHKRSLSLIVGKLALGPPPADVGCEAM